ncbi:MAG: glycogen debranching protein GlgX [Candidatus Omnitrophica bacterium]|nr:glycogen debranching protein GlgX [Candidatus Omnitrophota bacterium]
MKHNLSQNTTKSLSAGKNAPLGASLTAKGVNFAIFSKYAKEVYLLLFDNIGTEPTDIISLNKGKRDIWHIFVNGIKEGQLYAYKVSGDYIPGSAYRFNPNKLLMDPYAKAVTGKFINSDHVLQGFSYSSPQKDLSFDKKDTTESSPKCIVIKNDFDWQGDKRPDIPMEDLIIYETHVRGLTYHHTSKVRFPGTYLGLIEKIPYLKSLGVNAVKLLPVHEFHNGDHLADKKLKEYWGYNTIGFFAPESSYSTKRFPGCQVDEFKTMVKELHRAGIEVILDVVYNHTGEGNESGPTISFRGIDNGSYYYLKGEQPNPFRFYNDSMTGCGNTLYAEGPNVKRLILESLRYWAEVMRVDGFRFDLATVISRKKGSFSPNSSFFEFIKKDPVLCKLKLIAEPWDLTTYQLGNFPKNWSEWNDKFRDTSRRFLIGQAGVAHEFALRFTGSSDIFAAKGKSPQNSINFITCHDGFTLRDLFSYNKKHNKENLENNVDGRDENYSWNCGFEGKTIKKEIARLRRKMVKNSFCCLFFSLGTPMLLGGDEFSRTQKGNNNAYCQDNTVNWYNWKYVESDKEIFEFCKKAIAFRKAHRILRYRKYTVGKQAGIDNLADVKWFSEKLEKINWGNNALKSFACQIEENRVDLPKKGYKILILFNMGEKDNVFRLPYYDNFKWYRQADTSLSFPGDFLPLGREELLEIQDDYPINQRTIALLIARQK